MSSKNKGRNRHRVVKKNRKVLKNVSVDVGSKVSGKKVNGSGYGVGIRKADFSR